MICERCHREHTEEELESLMKGWLIVYNRHPQLRHNAIELARAQLAKHAPAPKEAKPPWYIRLAARALGGKEMANAVKSGWKKLDGWKTVVGALLLFLSVALPALVEFLKDIGADPQWSAVVGAIIMVVGVLHKIWKKFFPVVEDDLE
jgi:hypothetical protein